MRVTLVKTSSLGDVVHLLPAVADAAEARPDVRFSWVVEEAFAAVPLAHPAIQDVVPVQFRAWRERPFAAETRAAWRAFRRAARATRPDLVIDAQGLVKSALMARAIGAPVTGPGWQSAREPLASLAYATRLTVPPGRHAVERLRLLLALALGYRVDSLVPRRYGLVAPVVPPPAAGVDGPYLVFLHGTTWATKFWPVPFWRQLAARVAAAGLAVRLPWHGEEERQRALAICRGIDGAEPLPALSLERLAPVVGCAAAVVGVDSGLSHLAAAYDVPVVGLYGPTNPVLTGVWGGAAVNLASNFPCAPCLRRTCAWDGAPEHAEGPDGAFPVQPPCFNRITPELVWEQLRGIPAVAPLVR